MKISLGTIIRTVLLLLALVNQVLTSTGHPVLPFENHAITELVTILFTTATSLASWWKNNSYTKSAIDADRYLQDLKNKN